MGHQASKLPGAAAHRAAAAAAGGVATPSGTATPDTVPPVAVSSVPVSEAAARLASTSAAAPSTVLSPGMQVVNIGICLFLLQVNTRFPVSQCLNEQLEKRFLTTSLC